MYVVEIHFVYPFRIIQNAHSSNSMRFNYGELWIERVIHFVYENQQHVASHMSENGYHYDFYNFWYGFGSFV